VASTSRRCCMPTTPLREFSDPFRVAYTRRRAESRGSRNG
jgi:hypothetical protein